MNRKINIILILFIGCLTLLSCERKSLETYSGKDSLYFTWAEEGNGNNGSHIDSLHVSFAFDNPDIEEKVINIPVSVQGEVVAQDRSFKVSVSPSSTATEGVDFKLPEQAILHANKATDSLPITLIRSEAVQEEGVVITISLEPNENFSTEMRKTDKDLSYTEFTISVDDNLTQPSGWFEPFLGKFTAKKFFLMIDLLDLDPNDFDELGMIPLGEMQFYAAFMKRYLNEKKAAGETIYEEDGTEMVMGPAV